MEQVLYQRPREKIRESGAEQLSLAELLQVVLGSGSVRSSVARISRQVAPILQRGSASYEKLRIIEGVGDAKACQLLAVQELMKRGYG